MGGLQVVGELAEIGYDAEWRVVSAAGLGAPHRRDRIIIVAYPIDQRQQGWKVESKSKLNRLCFNEAEHKRSTTNNQRMAATKELADSKGECSNGRQPGNDNAQRTEKGLQKQIRTDSTNAADLATYWQVEPRVGRVANGVSARVDRLRGLGNAVVPQVAEYIGRLVMAAELNNS